MKQEERRRKTTKRRLRRRKALVMARRRRRENERKTGWKRKTEAGEEREKARGHISVHSIEKRGGKGRERDVTVKERRVDHRTGEGEGGLDVPK